MFALFILPALAGSKHDITLFDDIPADGVLAPGDVWCSEGDTVWLDPVTPVCPAGGTLKVRDVEIYSCFTALDEHGGPEPRLSGTGWYTVNGNFDLDYTGPMSGTYVSVPFPGCDVDDLVNPDSWWEGKWNGVRTVTCDGVNCTWFVTFKVVGKGHGGEIDGLQFRAQETHTQFTPLPIPWDLIPGFPVTGPEGIANGVIF
jgi:hypothetical protein